MPLEGTYILEKINVSHTMVRVNTRVAAATYSSSKHWQQKTVGVQTYQMCEQGSRGREPL